MNLPNTRRGNTQEVVYKNGHSKFNLESHHVLLSKVRSRIKYGMTPHSINGKCMTRGFILRPSSSRRVSMWDIGAAHTFLQQYPQDPLGLLVQALCEWKLGQPKTTRIHLAHAAQVAPANSFVSQVAQKLAAEWK